MDLQTQIQHQISITRQRTVQLHRVIVLLKILTSFLSCGKRNGSLTLSPATIVRIGSKQRKIAPIINIFPSLGSNGSIAKNSPGITARTKKPVKLTNQINEKNS